MNNIFLNKLKTENASNLSDIRANPPSGGMTAFRPAPSPNAKDTYIKKIATDNPSATGTVGTKITPPQGNPQQGAPVVGTGNGTEIGGTGTTATTGTAAPAYSKAMQDYITATKSYKDFQTGYQNAQIGEQGRVQPNEAITGELGLLARQNSVKEQNLQGDVKIAQEGLNYEKDLAKSAYEKEKDERDQANLDRKFNEDVRQFGVTEANKLQAARISKSGSGSNGLLDAVLANPELFDQLTPTQKAQLAPGLSNAGFSGFRKLTAAQMETQNDANSALLSLKTIEDKVKNPDGSYSTSRLINLGLGPTGFAERELRDVVTRVRTGAALSTSEESFYKKQVPRPIDSDETVKLKVNQLAAFYSGLSGNAITLELPDGSVVVADDMYDQQTRADVRKAIADGANVVEY